MTAFVAWFIGAQVSIPKPDFLNADYSETDYRV